MNRSVRAPATPFRFSPALQRQLNHYALAASAAGVSVLALVYPADAKVVFTPVHQVIGHNGVYNLDLLLGEELSKIEDVKRQLSKLYQMKDLGPTSSYLGI